MKQTPSAKLTRLIWIDVRLNIGTLNRSDLTRAFGISDPQAGNDIREYQVRFPKLITYDHRKRHYKRQPKANSAYPQHLRNAVHNLVHALAIYQNAAHSNAGESNE